jgi:hypothetical protein
MPATITKANKNFVCYAIVGVLRMLYDSSCEHLEGLQSVMAVCDASILEDLPQELSKLTGRIVKRWWARHGLPEASHCLRRVPEVSISSMSCNALAFYVDVRLDVFLGSWCRQRKLWGAKVSMMKNRLKILTMMKVHRCLMTEATLCLKQSRAIKMQPKVTNTVRCGKGEVSHLECSRRFGLCKFKQCLACAFSVCLQSCACFRCYNFGHPSRLFYRDFT